MHKIRLLERLSALEEPRSVAGVPPERQLRQSIINHLQQLLNARAGSVPIDANYGMPDMSNIAGSFAMGTTEFLSETIIRQVSRYEPRLKHPRISVEEETRDVITLRFELSGQITSSRSDAVYDDLTMTLRINASGRIYVQEHNDR